MLGPGDVEVPWDGSTVGEICARSNHVMIGYLRAPEATDAVLRGGWLRTGDLAVVDPDGYLTIVDRAKDLIVSGGENIASVEVEHVIETHPAVREAAVVGVPDERWGEVPRAFVTLVPGAELAGQPSSSPGCASAWPRSRPPSRSSSSTSSPRAAPASSRSKPSATGRDIAVDSSACGRNRPQTLARARRGRRGRGRARRRSS